MSARKDDLGREIIMVRELIELLRDCNQDALVRLEGCDCTGPCGGVEMSGVDGSVLLYRGEYVDDDE